MKGDALASCLGMDADDDDVPVAMLLQKAAEADDETGSGESKEDGNTSLTCSDEPEEETPKRAKRSNGMAKPYIQQANHTQHDTQRKLEVGANKIPCPNLHLPSPQDLRLTSTPMFSPVVSQAALNRVAHTPDFKPGPYKAYKLSDDAAQLLAHFIQRPSIRAQLVPLVGDIPGKKRKGSSSTRSTSLSRRLLSRGSRCSYPRKRDDG